jgi:hypothetical protein
MIVDLSVLQLRPEKADTLYDTSVPFAVSYYYGLDFLIPDARKGRDCPICSPSLP